MSESRELPLAGQVLATVDFPESGYGNPPETASDVDEANLITSKVDLGYDVAGTSIHKPVLDIDLPVRLVASSTPGHFHLFIDKAMTWDKYKKLLDVLADVGIVEPGYVRASKQRGFSAARLPWVKKEDARD
ncbi:hypothetical protein ACFOOK_26185 [Micromonospora krabiensis]|uniref:Uncharacterized protein n=1 Tax=Micromonospora krabiensis TaxID=307121 RepID=A0A1C3N5T6_9ACTN|nr:hypothetical protein [Micromonospora krabiensis]SBV27945.1 hypothetical protein GA0070620_3476 [Micromonospora krabiensis]